MNRLSLSALVFATATLTACAASETTSPLITDEVSFASGTSGGVSGVSCELRTGRRSKASVDGNNLAANAMYSSRITSGGVTIASPAQRAIGDEVEFDYDSDPANVRRGATAIPRNFIKVSATGPDLVGEILNASGAVVFSAGVDCAVR